MGVVTGDSPDEATPTIATRRTRPDRSSKIPRDSGGPSSPTLGQSTLKDQGEFKFDLFKPTLTVDDVAEFWNIQVPLENLARNKDVAARAYHWAKEHVRKFQDRIVRLHERWSLNQIYLKGDYYDSDSTEGEIHSAEMFKARETIVPRIEEAVFGYDEWYDCAGRKKISVKQERVLKQYLDYQIERDRFRRKAGDGIRSMVDYGFAVFKTYWHTETKRVRERNFKKVTIDDREYLVGKPTEVEKVTWNGPRSQLIDPFDFIIDTDSAYPEDAIIVGDYSRMTFEQVSQRARLQDWSNWEDLENATPQKRAEFSDYYKRERKVDETNVATGVEETPDGSPQVFEVLELWGMFDLFDTGIPRDCVVTIVNNTNVVRVQENPYDDKHLPYAISRANAEPFEFFGVGPMDHATRFEAAISLYRQLYTRGLEAHINAPVVTGKDEDIPWSLAGLDTANQILSLESPELIRKLDLPVPTREVLAFTEHLTQDIEEVSGGSKVLGGADDSDTATESVNRLNESNRRLRAYAFAYAEMCGTVLEHFHSLNRQFSFRSDEFRVLGRDAANMSVYEEVDPMTFQVDLDFSFQVMTSRASGEARAAQLAAILSQAYPWVQILEAKYPDSVDWLWLFQEYMRETMGLAPRKIIKVPTAPEDLPTPEQENQMLLVGEERPEVDKMDDDDRHIEQHMMLVEHPEILKDWRKQEALVEHVTMHVMQAERKQQAQQIMQQQQQMAAERQPQQVTTDHDRGSTGRDRSGGPSFMDNPAQTPMGETPGPTDQQRVAAGDRGNASTFQSGNEARR